MSELILTDDERELIEVYRALDELDRRVAISVLTRIKASEEKIFGDYANSFNVIINSTINIGRSDNA